jgi:hypothetical protein
MLREMPLNVFLKIVGCRKFSEQLTTYLAENDDTIAIGELPNELVRKVVSPSLMRLRINAKEVLEILEVLDLVEPIKSGIPQDVDPTTATDIYRIEIAAEYRLKPVGRIRDVTRSVKMNFSQFTSQDSAVVQSVAFESVETINDYWNALESYCVRRAMITGEALRDTNVDENDEEGQDNERIAEFVVGSRIKLTLETPWRKYSRASCVLLRGGRRTGTRTSSSSNWKSILTEVQWRRRMPVVYNVWILHARPESVWQKCASSIVGPSSAPTCRSL